MRRGTVFVNEVEQVDTEANLTNQDKIFLANVEEVDRQHIAQIFHIKLANFN